MKYTIIPVCLLISAFTHLSCTHSKTNTVKHIDKSKLRLIVYDKGRWQYEAKDSIDKSKPAINAKVLLFNDSDDTLKLGYPSCNRSRLYKVDNKNLMIIDTGFDCRGTSLRKIVILPHSYYFDPFVDLRYRSSIPKITFSFKLGLHLLPWSEGYKTAPPDDKTITNSDLIWSDNEQFNADESVKVVERSTAENKTIAQSICTPLTTNQINNYVFSIDKNQISKPRDTSDNCHEKCKYVTVPVKLANNTDDTLEYNDMTCAWLLIYQVKTPGIKILSGCGCDANAPFPNKIAPHKDTLFMIPLYYNNKAVKPGTPFKIGMTLLKSKDGLLFEFFDFLLSFLNDNPKYNIWTDEVIIPK